MVPYTPKPDAGDTGPREPGSADGGNRFLHTPPRADRPSVQYDLFGAPVPVVNPDGSVKGRRVIYVPKSEAFEYAALATSPYVRCGHSCAYCSVPITMRMDRAEFNAGAILRP